jgi:transcriptional regulator with XRE-family HTH domain
MGTAFASEAAYIRDLGNLEVEDIARATGADKTTVRAWLRADRSPSGRYAERLAELSSIVERLVRVIASSYVPVWLRKPNALLEDDKPIDVIAAGDYRKVSKIISALETTPAT